MSSEEISGLRGAFHRNKALNALRLLAHRFKNLFYSLLSRLGYKYDLGVYDDEFFGVNQEEGLKFAEWFIPLLRRTFQLNSLIDVGCGTGHYLHACRQSGISDVFGMEGSPFAFKHLLVPDHLVVRHDLRKPFQFDRRWDLALSLEVAEHIDDVDTDNYVRILCNASDVVVITAAPLGQGGTRHVNEHSRSWWTEKFSGAGYRYDAAATDKMILGIREAKAQQKFVASWFEPNIMVFRRTATTPK